LDILPKVLTKEDRQNLVRSNQIKWSTVGKDLYLDAQQIVDNFHESEKLNKIWLATARADYSTKCAEHNRPVERLSDASVNNDEITYDFTQRTAHLNQFNAIRTVSHCLYILSSELPCVTQVMIECRNCAFRTNNALQRTNDGPMDMNNNNNNNSSNANATMMIALKTDTMSDALVLSEILKYLNKNKQFKVLYTDLEPSQKPSTYSELIYFLFDKFFGAHTIHQSLSHYTRTIKQYTFVRSDTTQSI